MKSFFRGELPAAPRVRGSRYKVAKKGDIRKVKQGRSALFHIFHKIHILDANFPMPYPRNIAEIIGRFPLMPLDAGAPDSSATDALEDAMLERLFGGAVILDKTSARLCQAGLRLLAGDLDGCHGIVQSIGTHDAGIWHAILHRREGDFGNSVYWFQRAGAHGIYPALLGEARVLAGSDPVFVALAASSSWSAEEFVNVCRRVTPATRERCRKIQQAEWHLLFDWCYVKATEGI